MIIKAKKKIPIEIKHLLENLLNYSSQGIIVHEDQIPIFVNKKMCELLKSTEKEIFAKSAPEFPMEADIKMISELLKKRKEKTTLHDVYDIHLIAKDGEHIPVRVTSLPLLRDSKSLVLSLVSDLRGEQRMKEELSVSQKKYEDLFHNSLVGMYRSTIDGQILEVNKALIDTFGLEKENIKNASDQYVLPKDRNLLMKLLKKYKKVENFETKMYDKYGKERSVLLNVRLLENLGYMEGVVIDITAKNQAKEELKKSERKFHQLFHNSLVGMFRATMKEGTILAANQMLCEIIEDQNPVGKSIVEWYKNPGDKERLENILLKEQRVDNFEIQLKNRKWISLTAQAYPEEDYFEGVTTEITKNKRTAQKLLESESGRQAILNAIPDMMFRFDKSLRFIDYNAPDPNQLFLPPNQFVGKNAEEVLPKHLVSELRSKLKRVIKKGIPTNLEYKLEVLGKLRSYEARIVKSGHDEVLCIVRDISEKKEAEGKLRYRTDFENLLTRLSTHFIELHSDQIDQGISDALEAISKFAGIDWGFIHLFNKDQSKLKLRYSWNSSNISNLELVSVPLNKKILEQMEKILSKTGYFSIETPGKIKNLPAEARKFLQINKIKSFVVTPLSRGGEIIGILGFANIDRKEKWPEDFVSLLKIAGEMFTNAILRKHSESEVNKLYDTQSRLFSQIAHSLKTPFAVALNNIELIGNISNNKKRKELLEEVKASIKDSTEIVSQLLKIAKMDLFPTGMKLSEFPLQEILQKVHKQSTILAKSYFPDAKHSALEEMISLGSIPNVKIKADTRALTEALLIVLDNALIHSAPEGKLPKIEIRSNRLKNSWVLIEVQDYGKGMSEKDLEQAFTLYYQGHDTKVKQKGSGIGLASCRKIIEAQGGRIQIISKERKGTTIKITLPVIKQDL